MNSTMTGNIGTSDGSSIQRSNAMLENMHDIEANRTTAPYMTNMEEKIEEFLNEPPEIEPGFPDKDFPDLAPSKSMDFPDGQS